MRENADDELQLWWRESNEASPREADDEPGGRGWAD